MTALLSIKDLRLSLPDFTATPVFGPRPTVEILKGLTFDIPRGGILSIVGASGSGKSTLGRALIRLLEPIDGQILFDGTDITHLDEAGLLPLRRQMQMIFQDPMSSLNPRHRIRRIIEAPLRLHNIYDKGAAEAALDRVGLSPALATRYPHELSGGQRQRVGIARAIALNPTFILADEIVSGLDVSSQAQILQLLADLQSQMGLTVVFISHDLSVVRRISDQVMVLESGRIVEHAPVQELFEAPKTDYTAELLAAIPLPDPEQDWT